MIDTVNWLSENFLVVSLWAAISGAVTGTAAGIIQWFWTNYCVYRDWYLNGSDAHLSLRETLFKAKSISLLPPRPPRTRREPRGLTEHSAVVSGWRKVIGGKVRIDRRTFTHPELSELEGAWVRIEFSDPQGAHAQFVFGPELTEVTR